MAKFQKGDWVTCIDSSGLPPHIIQRDEAYEVTDVSVSPLYGTESLRLYGYGAWYLANRFKLAPHPPTKNPCAEVAASFEVDWKSRFLNLEEKYAALEERFKRAERFLFLADHYNWSRRGLTVEMALRDFVNYVRCALGQEPVKPDVRLIPPRKYTFGVGKVFIGDKVIGLFKDITYSIDLKPVRDFKFRAYPPYDKPAASLCPDKVEPGEIPVRPAPLHNHPPSERWSALCPGCLAQVAKKE
jgi:hypothetical protein